LFVFVFLQFRVSAADTQCGRRAAGAASVDRVRNPLQINDALSRKMRRILRRKGMDKSKLFTGAGAAGGVEAARDGARGHQGGAWRTMGALADRRAVAVLHARARACVGYQKKARPRVRGPSSGVREKVRARVSSSALFSS